mgnify:CR=1 FL=1
MSFDLWIGPAIVAAVVSALVTVGGWFFQSRSARKLEQNRRAERVVDVQTALLAEIRSNAHHLSQYDPASLIEAVRERLKNTPDYRPFVPRETTAPVFNAIIREISVLQNEVIDPVVLFYTQMETIRNFADDLRGDRLVHLQKDQLIQMLEDYLTLRSHARKLADDAIVALQSSLGINRSVADRSDRQSAEDGSAASDSTSTSPSHKT